MDETVLWQLSYGMYAIGAKHGEEDKGCIVNTVVQITAENARARGIWCGVCGESASDSRLTETFLRMGITELSVAPSSILELRKRIRSVDLSAPQARRVEEYV